MMHLPLAIINNRNATPMFLSTHASTLTILLIMKKGYKQVNEKNV